MDKEEYLIWLKSKEIEALQRASELKERSDTNGKYYFDGKAQAFSEVWERILAGDGRLHPTNYNELNERYSLLAGNDR